MNAKKVLLSLGVIICFIGYSLVMRHGDDTAKVSLPVGTGNTPQGGTNKNNPSSQTPATPASPAPATSGQYKNGTYTGDTADAFYGNIQVQVTISSGKISDVVFLQYPNDRSTSVMINQQAMPLLKEEAIQAQSAQIDGVSGATDTSQAFVQSLASALSQAHQS